MAPKAKSTALADINMVASHGHDSHPRVQLEPTRDGMRAFLIKFKAILSQDLSDALDLYLDNPKAPKTTEAKTTHKAIWRALVPCLNGLDHLLLKIYRDCRQDDGPHAIFWLIKELDNKTPVSSVKSVIDLLKTTTFDGDIVSGIDGIISTNDRLDEPFQFSDAITSILILVHLPQQLSTLRNLIINEMSDDSVPPPRAILSRVKQELSLQGLDSSNYETGNMNFATFQRNSRKCFNCEAVGAHATWACPMPRVNCTECGIGAGHLSKYCFVKNNSPLPSSWSDERKNAMKQKRAEYAARSPVTANTANLCVEVDEMDTAEFWAAIGAK